METYNFPNHFLNLYLVNLKRIPTRLKELSASINNVVSSNDTFSTKELRFINRIKDDINEIQLKADESYATLWDTAAKSRLTLPASNASTTPTVASTTPTVAGGTPNEKNNNSAFLWALAAIGGIGLFAALGTGKRK